MLSTAEKNRLIVSRHTPAKKKSLFGQYFTPENIAAFMAHLFPNSRGNCRLLDAGAGVGALSEAFLKRWRAGGLNFDNVKLDAFEIDSELHPYLSQALNKYQDENNFHFSIREADFISIAVESLAGDLFAEHIDRYTHAIINPPYKKINSNSGHRLALRRIGIETVNLYSAFVALTVALVEHGGHIVAIIPRSFCNGPYYRPFRKFLIENSVIRRIHLFESRSKAFKDEKVLQENIIIHLERGGYQGPVIISTSTDDSFDNIEVHEYPFNRIVHSNDSEQFIHVPTSPQVNTIENFQAQGNNICDIGVQVSTGPVVDFRLKGFLKKMPEPGTVPLLYPAHFNTNGINWPIEDIKKSNAIIRNAETEKWLYPNGFYCVVRRFTAKEEKRRIVASVVDPTFFPGVPMLGFENHLNVFHQNKSGLPSELARGLAVFLNMTEVDEYFRRFNGHTQVNATDLKRMSYPSRKALIDLGKWANKHTELTQAMIDSKMGIISK
ncbi:Eco57I restriction-modification methylase domain-containing protein [Desulfatibacillum aliphaticivorans]|uniref:Eco57I restriction-modification methylase domain-containing protein n=1 Tax=Desulfatibacillum aliphaticivorans TaxID=218208 RepID=UPI000423B64A|nr:Eco57I restriction-modification methylase domain-containing protein [Desulfatibacillum aliphaticivorans]